MNNRFHLHCILALPKRFHIHTFNQQGHVITYTTQIWVVMTYIAHLQLLVSSTSAKEITQIPEKHKV